VTGPSAFLDGENNSKTNLFLKFSVVLGGTAFL
jgi:hypothetical protein